MFSLIWIVLVYLLGESKATAHCEILSFEFMRLAFDAVILISLLNGLIGPLVVGGRQVFLSHTLAHSSFAGLAIGVLLNMNLMLAMFAVLVLLAIAIAAIKTKSELSEDTAVGIGLSAAVAISLIVISVFLSNYKTLLFDYMFGNIIGLESYDLILLLMIVVIVGLLSVFFYNHFCFIELSPSIARARGIKVDLLQYLVVLIIAIIVSVGIKLVGIVLLTSLFVVPTAAARIISRSMRSWTAFTFLFTVTAGILGLILSYYLGFPVSASIVTCLVLIFVVVSAGNYFLQKVLKKYV